MQNLFPFKTANEMAEYVKNVNSQLNNFANKMDSCYSSVRDIPKMLYFAKKDIPDLKGAQEYSKAIEKHMQELTTIDINTLIYYLCNILTYIENNPYQYDQILENERKITSDSCYVIASYDVIRIIKASKEIKDIVSLKRSSLPGRYIILPEKPKIELLKGIELNPIFSSFPYLKDIAYEIIDIRKNNPKANEISALFRIDQTLFMSYDPREVNER